MLDSHRRLLLVCAAYVAVMFLLNGYVNTNAMMAPKAMPPHLKATAAGILAVTYQVGRSHFDCVVLSARWLGFICLASWAAACVNSPCSWLSGGALHRSDTGHGHHPGVPWRLLRSCVASSPK